MKKNVVIIAGLLGLVCKVSANEIDWGTGTSRIYYGDGITALSTNVVTKTSNTACFVQLIYAGADGTADTANVTSTGAMFDDVVVAWSYIGASQPGSQATSAGRFTRAGATFGYNNINYANGAEFFIRAWDLSSPDFSADTVPSGGHYGNSQLFSVTGNGSTPSVDQFTLTGSYSTILQAVPEPGAVTIAMAGVGILIGYRRYKRFYR